jgi:2-hydroxyglutarate dehydrogenase
MQAFITPPTQIKLGFVSRGRSYCTALPNESSETYYCRYEICQRYGIAHQNTGKWIVAQTPEQAQYLANMHEHARLLDVPTRFVSIDEVRRKEPDVRAKEAVLESSSTGIIDSHGLMMHLLGQFEDQGGDVAYLASVTAISTRSNGGFDITIKSEDGEEISIDAGVVVNSAGLYACDVSNMLLPKDRHMRPYYAKGNYFSYTASKPRPKRLIYPCPEKNLTGYPRYGPTYCRLGTHLTLDLAGRIRFGPDVQWITDPTDYTVSESYLNEVYEAISQYLPSVDRKSLTGDYTGIR